MVVEADGEFYRELAPLAFPVEGKAGGSVFFHVNTIHGSPGNDTGTARAVFIHRYRRADDYVVIGASSVTGRK